MTIDWFNQRFNLDYSTSPKKSNLFTHRAFIFALVVHLILALLLANLGSPTIKTSQKKYKIKAIQSYLYHPPAITQPVTLEKISTPKSLKKKTNQKNIKVTKSKKINPEQNKNKPIMVKKTSSAASKLPTPPQLPTPAAIRSKNSLSFSALEQLQQLQHQLDQQTINSEANYNNRARGASVFNDLPAAVPQSKTKLSPTGEISIRAKAKIKEVNCNNGLNQGIAIISGLMRGTIRCNSVPQLDTFIKNSLENKNVLNKKQKRR